MLETALSGANFKSKCGGRAGPRWVIPHSAQPTVAEQFGASGTTAVGGFASWPDGVESFRYALGVSAGGLSRWCGYRLQRPGWNSQASDMGAGWGAGAVHHHVGRHPWLLAPNIRWRVHDRYDFPHAA